MKEEIAQYVAVVLTSAVKFMIGVLGALGAGFNFIETMVCTIGGGMLGVFAYLYLWDLIVFVYRKIVPAKPKKGGIKINSTKRWIVKIIVKYELYGIAFLTPVLLSVPIGVLLASALEESKWRIKRYMFFSFAFWALLVYGIYALFGVRLDEWFKK